MNTNNKNIYQLSMKIRINTEAKFRWKLLMEGEEVDWAYYDIIVEITKPSHSKEIIDMSIDGSTLVFSYKPNQCGQYIATAYLNRYKPDEAALDVKIFEGVKWSWCADNNDDEITTVNLSGNISNGSVDLNNYYTKQEIDEKLEDIAVGDIDLTTYATKEWVGNTYQPKGNYLTSIPSEYVTESELETRLEKIDIPTTDLSDYYTKSEVDDKIDNITAGDVDLTGYATEEWTSANYQPKGDYQPAGNYLTSIPTEYVTETELEEAINNIDIPSTDLTGYATENWVTSNYQPKGNYQPAGNYLTRIPSEYVTEAELNAKGYLTSIPAKYVTEAELSAKGYITSIPAEYVTKTELNNKGYITSIPLEYVTETELNNKRYLTSVPAEYVTETELEEAINNIDIPTVDLTGYATEQWVTSNYQPKGNYQPAGNYLTSIPDEYITEAELNAKGYLTSIPSKYVTEVELENKGYLTSIPTEYVTETELNNKGYLTSIPLEYVTDTELSAKGYLTAVPDGYATENWVTSNYQPKGNYQPAGNYLTSIPSEYVTETEVNDLLGTKVGSSEITNIKQLTEAEYNALTTVDSKTIYIIVE